LTEAKTLCSSNRVWIFLQYWVISLQYFFAITWTNCRRSSPRHRV